MCRASGKKLLFYLLFEAMRNNAKDAALGRVTLPDIAQSQHLALRAKE